MLHWIIQITLVSIVIIVLVHHLIHFFKTTLTVPKLKDLVNRPTLQYQHMYNVLNQEKPSLEDKEYTLIDLLPPADMESNTNTNTNTNINPSKMKNELKEFLKSQLTN